MSEPAPSRIVPDPLLGTVLGDRFVIEEMIGAGAFGTVYRARHEALGHPVALKVLLPYLAGNREIIRRSRTEARVLLRVDHSGVVKFHDYFEADGRVVLVMELAPGESFDRILARDGPRPEAMAVEIAIGVLEVLEAIHYERIIHRDVKPANVMVHRTTDPGGAVETEVHLLDLGLARILDPESSEAGEPAEGRPRRWIGTEHYVSPEGLGGLPLDERADLYAVGVMLYETLSGQRPFEGYRGKALEMRVVDEEPPPLKDRASPAVAAVVSRALARDRDRRFPSAGAFAEALREAIAGRMPPPTEPWSAPRPRPPLRRARRWLSAGAGAAARLAAVLLAFIIGPDESSIEAERKRLAGDPIAALAVARATGAAAISRNDRPAAARAALLEAAALRAVQGSPIVPSADDLARDPAESLARAWRLSAGTPLEREVLEALGLDLLESARPLGALAALGLLAAGNPAAASTRIPLARAELAAGLLTECDARATGLGSREAEELRALAADLSPLLEVDTRITRLLAAGDLDGDGAAEVIGHTGEHELQVLALRESRLAVIATAATWSQDVQSAAILRAPDGDAPFIATAGLPSILRDREGRLELYEWRTGELHRRGEGIGVPHEARLRVLDLDGTGRPVLVAVHVSNPEQSVSVFDCTATGLSPREPAIDLIRPAGAARYPLDVFDIARVGSAPGRLVLATGLWDMLGLADAETVPGPPLALRLSASGEPALVQTVAADRAGGAAYAVTHNATSEPRVAALMAGSPRPGVYRLHPDGRTEPLMLGGRGAATTPDGLPLAECSVSIFDLAFFARGGRNRWVGKYVRQAERAVQAVSFVIEDRPGATPFWLPCVPYSPPMRGGVQAADLDGDGRTDLVALDPVRKTLCLAGVAVPIRDARPRREVPPALSPTASLTGAAAMLEVSENLSALGFGAEALAGFTDVLCEASSGSLARDAAQGAVAECLRTGLFERAHRMVEACGNRFGPAAELLLLRSHTYETQGLILNALDFARMAEESQDLSEPDLSAVRDRIRSLRALGKPKEDRRFGEGSCRLELDGTRHRADLIEPVVVGETGFLLSFAARFDGLRPGSGLAAGLEGDQLPHTATSLGAATRFPFVGFCLSHTLLNPYSVRLCSVEDAEETLGRTEYLPRRPPGFAEPATWQRVEVCYLPGLDLLTLRLYEEGRDERWFTRIEKLPERRDRELRLGLWLFRYDDDRNDATGTRVDVKDLEITIFER